MQPVSFVAAIAFIGFNAMSAALLVAMMLNLGYYSGNVMRIAANVVFFGVLTLGLAAIYIDPIGVEAAVKQYLLNPPRRCIAVEGEIWCRGRE